MSWLKAIPWKRVIGIIAGAATTYEAVQGGLPPWAQIVGGLIVGGAINAERIFAKREKGATPFDAAAARAKVDKMLMLVLMIGYLAAFPACETTGDIHLKGDIAEHFRKITGHGAVTVSEKVTIYGTENPPSAQLQCHENEHKKQAAVIADALVALGALDDDEPSRMAAWVAVYTIDWVQYGYAGSRFERGARAACPSEGNVHDAALGLVQPPVDLDHGILPPSHVLALEAAERP